jgi:hypothetical protein
MKTTALIKTALLALSVTLFAPLASATSFAITFSGSDLAGDTFSGTLIGTAEAGGTYNVTGGSGTVFSDGSTQAVDPSATAYGGPWDINNLGNSPSHFFNFDDIYYSTGDPSGDPFDHTGILLILANGKEVNLYCVAGTCYFDENDGLPQSMIASGGFTSSVATAPVPEPAGLVLFGTGVLGLAGVIRRRFNA